jgi:hypothetical protein
MSCLSPEVLSAIVDGEASAQEVEHARACPSCGGHVRRLRELDEALAALPLAAEGPSPVLAATLRGLSARAARPAARVARIATGGIVALAVASTILLSPRTGTIAEALAEQAIASHLRAFTTGSATGCQVESEDPGLLAEWLSAGFGARVEIPSPAAARLVGARSCQLFGESTPAVVYRTEEAPVTVFLPRPGTEAFAACERAMGSCVEGRDGQTVCVLPAAGGDPMVIVGALSATRLCQVVGS